MDQAYIKLDQFLKWSGIADTGGQAKLLVTSGQVKVNGEAELRRGRKLIRGDQVQFEDKTLTVELD